MSPNHKLLFTLKAQQCLSILICYAKVSGIPSSYKVVAFFVWWIVWGFFPISFFSSRLQQISFVVRSFCLEYEIRRACWFLPELVAGVCQVALGLCLCSIIRGFGQACCKSAVAECRKCCIYVYQHGKLLWILPQRCWYHFSSRTGWSFD